MGNRFFLRIFFSVFIFLAFINTAIANNYETLKFVQLSDIHLNLFEKDKNYRMTSQSDKLLNDALNQIEKNKKDIDFLMITGDGIDYSDAVLAFRLLNSLNQRNFPFPYYWATGNHDICASPCVNEKILRNMIKEENKHQQFDKSYFTFSPKPGYKVIVLDAVMKNVIGSCGFLPKEQLKWLNDTLKTVCKDDLVLIFLHHPLLPPIKGSDHAILNSEKFYSVLRKYNHLPIAIFSGHYHMTKIVKEKNILHVSSPSLIQYPNAFRIVEVRNLDNEVKFDIRLIQTGLKDVQQLSKSRMKNVTPYEGRKEDRTGVFIIEKTK